MATTLELLREGQTSDLWQKCCGFIDLDIEQFMAIQQQLLLEQIELLKKCELGQKLMRGFQPSTVEEFRRQVPITTYPDYAPYLPERIESALPEPPMLWQHSSGRSTEYAYKWVPVTHRMYNELGDLFLAVMLFASCSEKGEIVVEEHDKFLYGLAPPPYASGSWVQRLIDDGIFEFLPPLEQANNMDFRQRLEMGFKMGLSEGIDLMAGISMMLLAVGERLGQGSSLKSTIQLLNKPKLLARLMKAKVKSKLARRQMLPKDLWSLKGIISVGTDATVFRERIKEMWGRYPLDLYGTTESVIIAMQAWDYGDMTFVPHTNFLEFMPEKEYQKRALDPEYQPETVLLDEVIPGSKYVPVLTNFRGGAFVRYLMGDLIQITSLRNANLNINTPQMAFYSRADYVLDFTYGSLTEKNIWQAIEDSGIPYVDWVARKETQEGPKLHLFLELGDTSLNEKEIARIIDEQLRALKEDYVYAVSDLGFELLKVTLLPGGAFKGYRTWRESQGADMARLKPPHIEPSDEALSVLLGSEIGIAARV